MFVVDADEGYCNTLSRILSQHEGTVTHGRTLAHAATLIGQLDGRSWNYALVAERLPDGSGVSVLRALCRLRSPPRVALMTAERSAERYFCAAREGYVLVPRPVMEEEVFGLLRSLGGSAVQISRRGTFGGCLLEDETLLMPTGERIALRPAEAKLLLFLAGSRDQPVRAEEIARAVYERRDAVGAALVRRHVANIRRSLGVHAWMLKSTPRVGYHLDARCFDAS